MRSIALAWLAALIVSTASAGEPQFFYCYAPDAASGIVYQSQALAIGPTSERAGYGYEFTSFLKSSGRTRNELQAYCVMRASIDEIAHARIALANESCSECVGATRFESVSWPRNGRAMPAAAAVDIKSTASEKTSAKSSPKPDAHDGGPWLVVMGNTETGKFFVVSNQPNVESVAQRQANMIRTSGWKKLLVTSEPGFGAAFCVRHEGEVRFFVAHAQSSIKEAIAHARDFAAPYAAETAQEPKICGAPWHAQPGVETAPEEDAIDVMKEVIRKEVTCDAKAKSDDGHARPCPAHGSGAAGSRG